MLIQPSCPTVTLPYLLWGDASNMRNVKIISPHSQDGGQEGTRVVEIIRASAGFVVGARGATIQTVHVAVGGGRLPNFSGVLRGGMGGGFKPLVT